ncbi:MAG: FG-GAP repeat protein, partial [Planctomycetota bacterium]
MVAAAVGAVSRGAWGQWEQLHKLTAGESPLGDHFGGSVGVSGHIAIVGAPLDPVAWFGAAYLFDVTSGQQLSKLTPDDPGGCEHF